VAFGDIFRLGSGYSDTAVRGFPHALLAGKQAWIQKTSGPGGLMSYWYAFAGDPARTPAGGTAPYEELPPAPDEEAPYFVARTPVPGATNVSTTTSVTVRFNEAVLGVGSNNTVLRDNSTSAVVAATVTYDPATFTASLVPNAPLMANRLYRMAMSGSIVDTTGNPLPFSQWYFTTGASANAGFTNQVTFNPWRTVAFSAGTHTGYLYSSSGGVTGSKSYTLAAGSSASAAGRATINGTSHVLIANGVWANYWMPESGVVVLQVELAPPPAVNETYDPPRTLYLAAGTYVGRQFSSTGAITASKSYTLAAASSAPTSRRSTITGQSGTWFYITAGVWAGYWIPESSATTLAP
jgi:hypothetical protein